VVFTGTFDPDHSRNLILRRLIERSGCDVTDLRAEVWGSVRYSKMTGERLATAWRAARAYVMLAVRSLAASKPDAVVMLYPGHIDAVLLGPLWRLRGVSVVFDPFISLFDTIAGDRLLRDPRSVTGRIALLLDRWSCRIATVVLADTPYTADHLAEITGQPRGRIAVVWPGAYEPVFSPPDIGGGDPHRVLFYGTFIPLHGIDTIVRAAHRLDGSGILFTIVGEGQERARVEELVNRLGLGNVELVGRSTLAELAEQVRRAGICLGIFGGSEKAARVVPFKVFECLAVGRPVITGDTPAIRDALGDAVVTVPAGDDAALAAAIRALADDDAARKAQADRGHARYVESYDEAHLAAQLDEHLRRLIPEFGGREP
jgi:glycosyltransferase involved in cell wall biosynthesis